MLGPEVECLPFLPVVLRAVINAGDARLVAANVIKHGLNNVRLHTQLGHARGSGAA